MFIRLACFAWGSGSSYFEHQQEGLVVIKSARYQGKEERVPNLKLFRGEVELG